MNIGGFIKTSFVDYPGKISSVLFTQGCNLNCSYCHNAILINSNMPVIRLETDQVLMDISKRKEFIDAVVISGGEPTIQTDIFDFIKELRALKVLIKLDTNGTNPDVLSKLIEYKMLDFIAMDIKAPKAKYRGICQSSVFDFAQIKKSVDIIKESSVDYEFRTTLCPELTISDVKEIIDEFKLTSNYIVQNYRDENLKSRWTDNETKEYNLKEIKNIVDETNFCKIRGFKIA